MHPETLKPRLEARFSAFSVAYAAQDKANVLLTLPLVPEISLVWERSPKTLPNPKQSIEGIEAFTPRKNLYILVDSPGAIIG